MAEMSKKVAVKAKNISIDGEVMYMRLLAVNSLKKMPLHRIMSFENSSVPLSIFTNDGRLQSSGAKSDFMHKLKEILPGGTLKQVSEVDLQVIDGHAYIQMLQVPSQSQLLTFKDIGKMLLQKVIYVACKIVRDQSDIHIVFDNYEEERIKSQEREKRSSKGGIAHHIQLNGNVPKNWRGFLSHPENKKGLAKCLSDYIKEEGASYIKNGQFLWVGGGLNFKTFKVLKVNVFSVPELDSTQEEADTRMILHLHHSASSGVNKAVVCSPGTDVLVLLVENRSLIECAELYMFTGKEEKHTSNKRFIPVHQICDQLTADEMRIILPVYCITGCDTVSSFYGHEKKNTFKVLRTRASKLQGLKDLGEEPELTSGQLESAVKFVRMMYGDQNITSLNELRSKKASGKVGARKLPPCDNSFECHLKRALLQLFDWRHVLEAKPAKLNPLEYAWE